MNVYLIYKENYDTTGMAMLDFRESLVRSLLLTVPYENLRPGPRERSTSRTKRKLVDYKFDEKEGSAPNVGGRCTGCYTKGRAQQSRETSNIPAKKAKTSCFDCDKGFLSSVL